jgi:LTXXQ motif family protein
MHLNQEMFMNRTKLTHFGGCTVAATALLCMMTFANAVAAAQGSTGPAQPAHGAQAPSAASSASKPNVDPDEVRIKGLHDQLKITPEQETLWGSVTQIMRSNDEKIDALATERHNKASTMTAVEDLRSYGDVTEAHATGIKTFVPAFEKLYNSMSAAQKANADKIFRTGGRKTLKKAG